MKSTSTGADLRPRLQSLGGPRSRNPIEHGEQIRIFLEPEKGGRKKGTPNKVTAAAKEVIAAVATQLGGEDRMLAWVNEDPQNERIFWSQIYPKLLSLQVTGLHDGPIVVRWKEPGEVL